jgi:hypothetical protein
MAGMFCPMCGSQMVESSNPTGEKRIDLVCTGQHPCFKEDYPLYFHQAWQGTDSRPGDSWSLTWLK